MEEHTDQDKEYDKEFNGNIMSRLLVQENIYLCKIERVLSAYDETH